MKKKSLIWKILLLIAIAAVCISGFLLYQRFKEDKDSKEEYITIRDYAGDRSAIDWDKLRKINPDVVGWIYVPHTTIDYPIVQGSSNSEYLHKSFEGKYLFAGCIFLDAKCDKSFSSDNSIVYGHHMNNGSMFAPFVKFKQQDFVKKYRRVYLYTPQKTWKLKIISAYPTSGYGLKIPIDFADKDEKNKYLNNVKKKSVVSISSPENKDINQLFTFVTCSYERKNNRTLVHAIEDD